MRSLEIFTISNLMYGIILKIIKHHKYNIMSPNKRKRITTIDGISFVLAERRESH